VYDKFHVMQHANKAVDEVRRAECFRRGGWKRAVGKGKRWLVLTRWVNLSESKRQMLNELFSLNRRMLLSRGRGYENLRYLLLKAQRLAATKTEFIAMKKAA
jgi:transposase